MATTEFNKHPAGTYPDSISSNHSTAIRASIWTLVSLAGLALVARAYAKLSTRGLPSLWLDDWFGFASWVLLVCIAVDTDFAVSIGFGSSINSFDHTTEADIILLSYISVSLGFIASAWSKTSFILQLLRCASNCKWLRIILWGFFGLINILLGITSLIPWVMCSPTEKAWKVWLDGRCDAQHSFRGITLIVTLFCMFFNMTLALLPIKVLRFTEIPMRERIGVLIAMGFAAVASAAAFEKATYPIDPEYFLTSMAARHTIWSVAEVTATIIATAIPTFRLLASDQKGKQRIDDVEFQPDGGSSKRFSYTDGHKRDSGRSRHSRSRSSQIFKPGLRIDTGGEGVRGKAAIVSVKSLNSAESPEEFWSADTDPYDVGMRDLAATPTTPTTPRNMV